VKSALLSLVVLLAFAYVGLCLYVYFFQRSLVYFPTAEVPRAPAEELWLESAGASLRLWRLHADRPDAILYFGGNAEAVDLNIPEFSSWFPRHAVYLVNYRGYGGSSGSPSEAGLYRDAEAVFDFAMARHATVSVIGRSLGSGVATHLAAVRRVERLVLVTPFDSFISLAQAHYPLFPTSLLLKERYDSASRAGRIETPVLLLTAEHDEIVPRESSARLAAAIDPSLITLSVIENTAHNSIGSSPDYGQALRNFLYAPLAGQTQPAIMR
jgi:uncharacterized protein